jgi:hypothetical protein
MPLEDGPDEDMTATEQFMNVVDQAAKEKKEAPMFAKKAWICLDREAVPRKQCIAIMSHKFFDPVILTLIGLNCLTMIIFNEPVLKKMIESYPNGEANSFDTKSPNWAPNGLGIFRMSAEPFHIIPGCVTGPCSTAEWIDWVFLVLFTVEMAIKMLAQGLCMHPHSYLRSGWNWLDFVVVIIGYLETYSTGLPGISTLRLFKTLRPLRSLQRIRGMRVLVQCILEAMPQMCNVLLFLFFIIFFFALFGVALFKGGLRFTCHEYNGDKGEWESIDDVCRSHCTWTEEDVVLDSSITEPRLGGCLLGNDTLQQESYYDKVHMTYSCRPGQECRCTYNGLDDPYCSVYSNPNNGITSFESLPWAFVSLFQAISLEGW